MIISRGLVKGKTTMYISIRSKDIDSEYTDNYLYINYISIIHIFSEIVIHFHKPRFANKT